MRGKHSPSTRIVVEEEMRDLDANIWLQKDGAYDVFQRHQVGIVCFYLPPSTATILSCWSPLPAPAQA